MNQSFIKSLASQFRTEISRKGNQPKFSWSHTVRGPLDEEFIDYICYFAGCWSEILPNGDIRFFTDSSHPSWKGEEEKSEPIDYYPEITRRERRKLLKERQKKEKAETSSEKPRSKIRVRYF